MIVLHRYIESFYLFISDYDRQITRHKVKQFIIYFLLNSALNTVMKSDIVVQRSFFNFCKVKTACMGGYIRNLDTGKQTVNGCFRIACFIAEGIFFY